jgi:hypothetical protein
MYFIKVKKHPILMMQPCKIIFINTPKISKMYKGIRKRENVQDTKLAQTRCQNLSMSKRTSLNNFDHIEKIVKLSVRVSIKVLVTYKRAEL